MNRSMTACFWFNRINAEAQFRAIELEQPLQQV
jgi:hypothetical protein